MITLDENYLPLSISVLLLNMKPTLRRVSCHGAVKFRFRGQKLVFHLGPGVVIMYC